MNNGGEKGICLSTVKNQKAYGKLLTKEDAKLHSVSPKYPLEQIFLGSALTAGGGWTGDQLVADAEDDRQHCIRSLRHEIQRKRSGSSKK